MKPLVSLIVRMAECREDVIMTYLVDDKLDKVMDELAKLPDQRLKKIEGRIQYVVRRTRLSNCNNSDGVSVSLPI